ncbi:MAG: hypothetical protein KIT84_33795 [Labilithrix sp.]|nr:hypothetical protein [Labilithrix sp.]MCW5816022.1 hypothetical protein [Labilithrix sp.]
MDDQTLGTGEHQIGAVADTTFEVVMGIWETSRTAGTVDVWYDDVLVRLRK